MMNTNRNGICIVSYGGGVNSTAMLVGLVERHECPEAILFADTGGEQADCYQYVVGFSAWLQERGFPEIRTVRGNYKSPTLEAECLRLGVLPSLAYGGRSCSLKWKRDPQDIFLRNSEAVQKVWAVGERVIKLIGFDAGENRRAKRIEDERYVFRYPLIEWGWDRKACQEVVSRAGLCVPAKSACFFCPASKKAEVRRLAKEQPEVFARALEIERRAQATGKLTAVKGLGRSWSWANLVAADKAQLKLFEEPPQVPCECWD